VAKIRKAVKRFIPITLPILLVVSLLINFSCLCTRTNEQVLDGIKNWVAKNRQLPELTDIEYEFITRQELHDKLQGNFEAEYDEQEEAIQKELLILLGLIEEDLDLYQLYLDLNKEQIAGYYDQKTKKMYVISDEQHLSVRNKMTFAHEITHALQDQHYDIEALLELSGDDSEYSMGIKSLMEGDATLAQGFFYWQALNGRERDIYVQESDEMQSPIYDNAPEIIKESLIFPYREGSEFVLSIYEDGGWDAVNSIYDNPPKSMEQIMHPEKYTAGDNPIVVGLPDLEALLGGSWDQKEAGALGEFDLKHMLEAFIEPSEATTEATAGWGGDSFAYLRDDNGDKVLVVHSVWDSVIDAQEFFDIYADNRADDTWLWAVDGLYKKGWRAGDMITYLEISGDDVLLIVAPDASVADTVADAILP
jgi:hypothetical protein